MPWIGCDKIYKGETARSLSKQANDCTGTMRVSNIEIHTTIS